MELSPETKRLLLGEFYKFDLKPADVASFMHMSLPGVYKHFKKLKNAKIKKHSHYTKTPFDVIMETGLKNHPEILKFLSEKGW